MTDYVWFPVTGDGQTSLTPYVWNSSPQSWNITANWIQGSAIDFVTYPLTPGDVPGSGSGSSSGPGNDNAYIYSGEIQQSYMNIYNSFVNPANGIPYIYGNSFQSNVVINSGLVDINNLTLAAFNQYADSPQFSTLSVQGATLEVQGSISDTGTLIFPTISFLGTTFGGTLTASGGGTIDLGTGATVQIGGTVASTINLDFLDGNSNLLSLGGVTSSAPTAFGGVIQNFAVGDTSDLTSVQFTGNAAPVLNSTTNVLTVIEGGTSYNLQFDASVSGKTFVASADASGNGTDITIACYCAGTAIATARGDVAVEDLKIGDLLLTASGKLRPLKWIGTRAYSARFARNNAELLPIRFKAGSVAPGVPARDLLVSPKHAMFLDGVLIPAEHLVNGATIVKEAPGEDIHYFHLELETHDVLIAEGAFSESFVDDDSRGMFQNAHEFGALYPDERPGEAVYCAPRVEDGYALDRVRRRLAERAGLSYPAAADFGALLGAVERCDHEGVSGWALSTAFRNAPVCLDVIVDGVFMAYAYAASARAKGGWRFDMRFCAALDPSRAHDIELRRSADGARLARLVLSDVRSASHAG